MRPNTRDSDQGGVRAKERRAQTHTHLVRLENPMDPVLQRAHTGDAGRDEHDRRDRLRGHLAPPVRWAALFFFVGGIDAGLTLVGCHLKSTQRPCPRLELTIEAIAPPSSRPARRRLHGSEMTDIFAGLICRPPRKEYTEEDLGYGH